MTEKCKTVIIKCWILSLTTFKVCIRRSLFKHLKFGWLVNVTWLFPRTLWQIWEWIFPKETFLLLNMILRGYSRNRKCPALLNAVILEFIPNQNVIQMCSRVVRPGMHSCASFSWQESVVTPVLPCKPMICLVRVLKGRINSLFGKGGEWVWFFVP